MTDWVLKILLCGPGEAFVLPKQWQIFFTTLFQLKNDHQQWSTVTLLLLNFLQNHSVIIELAAPGAIHAISLLLRSYNWPALMCEVQLIWIILKMCNNHWSLVIINIHQQSLKALKWKKLLLNLIPHPFKSFPPQCNDRLLIRSLNLHYIDYD